MFFRTLYASQAPYSVEGPVSQENKGDIEVVF